MSLAVKVALTVGTFHLGVQFESSGGVTALFGPSGAGKTLTLRTIAGLARPMRGRIVIGDETVFDGDSGIDVAPRDRGCGYVFQQYALFPHLSVERNVAFGIQDLHRTDRAGRVRELVELVGLTGLERRRPGELSGGQQQRVALARALAPRPKILLLDEPFAAVDLRVRRRLREELRRLHDLTGTPMVLVTHDLHEVRELADSLVLLDQGQVLGHGPTDDVLSRPFDEDLMELLHG